MMLLYLERDADIAYTTEVNTEQKFLGIMK